MKPFRILNSDEFPERQSNKLIMCIIMDYINNFLLEVAIDSRLSPAKVRWRQPAVSSELSLVTAS